MSTIRGHFGTTDGENDRAHGMLRILAPTYGRKYENGGAPGSNVGRKRRSGVG